MTPSPLPRTLNDRCPNEGGEEMGMDSQAMERNQTLNKPLVMFLRHDGMVQTPKQEFLIIW